MENASQALFIAAGVLIAVMIITIGVYLFSSASTISESYDSTMSANDIQQFNSKFQIYSKTYKKENGSDAEKNFNLASEVVSAVNLAYSINNKNNYDQQASVDVIIDLRNLKDFENEKFKSKIYAIWPYEPTQTNKISANRIYEIDTIPSERIEKSTIPKESLELNIFLEEFSKDDSKKFKENSERAYYYGFNGEVKINSETGLVNKVIFTAFNF